MTMQTNRSTKIAAIIVLALLTVLVTVAGVPN